MYAISILYILYQNIVDLYAGIYFSLCMIFSVNKTIRFGDRRQLITINCLFSPF